MASGGAFPVTEARFFDLVLESIFFGIHIITLSSCLWDLLVSPDDKVKRASAINWPMVLVATAMGLIAGLDLGCGVYHMLRAFVFYKGPGGPLHEFTNISFWVNIVRTTTVSVQTLIGDGMLIFRCWTVYGRQWRVVAFSIALWIGGFVCASFMLHLELTLHSRVLVNTKAIQPFASSFWALTVVLNILTTSLLVGKIWTVDRRTDMYKVYPSQALRKDSYLRRAMRSAVESGALYTIVAFITFVVYVTKSNAIFVVTHVEIQVVGIAFDLIIIRASRYRRADLQSGVRIDASASTRTGPLRFRNDSAVDRADAPVLGDVRGGKWYMGEEGW